MRDVVSRTFKVTNAYFTVHDEGAPTGSEVVLQVTQRTGDNPRHTATLMSHMELEGFARFLWDILQQEKK